MSLRLLIDGDVTLVTSNSKDFRGHAGKRVAGGLHRREAVHAGLVCLNSVFGMDVPRQHRRFGILLAELASRIDLIDRAIEIFEFASGALERVEYELP